MVSGKPRWHSIPGRHGYVHGRVIALDQRQNEEGRKYFVVTVCPDLSKEYVEFSISLRLLAKYKGDKPQFKLGELISMDHPLLPPNARGRNGWVVETKVDHSNPFKLTVGVRLQPRPEVEYGRSPLVDVKLVPEPVGSVPHQHDDLFDAIASGVGVPRNILMARPKQSFFAKYVHGIKRSGEMSFPLNFNDGEKQMKIYEAVVVRLDENKKPVEIAKVVTPFLAEHDRAAQDAVMVDFAQEKGLTGKDLAGYVVSVRTFQAMGSY